MKLYTICFIFILIACTEPPKKGTTNSSKDVVEISIQQNNSDFKIEDIIDTIYCVELETKLESLIGDIYLLRTFQDHFYILSLDGSSISIFDKKGKYITRINDQGRGPKEYIRITYFSIDPENKNIIVTDGFSKKIFIYDLNGNQKSVITTDFIPNYVTRFNKNEFINFESSNKTHQENPIIKENDLHFFNFSGKIERGKITNQTPLFINYATPNSISIQKNGHILYGPLLSDTLYKINNEGEVNPLYVLKYNFPGYKAINPNQKHKIQSHEHLNQLEELEKQNYLYYNGVVFDSPSYLITEYGTEKRKRLLYFKDTQKTYFYDIAHIDGDKALKSLTRLIRTHNNDTMFSAFSPAMLKIMAEVEGFTPNKYTKLFESIDEENNPVIFCFKFKEPEK